MPREVKTISFADSAFSDLDEVLEWYATRQVPDVGKQLVRDILLAVERLADFPESGRIVPEFSLANLRELIHPPFRIVYRLDENRVRIVRIWHSERLLKIR
jgi:plasmid stabilization system protein ParE